MKIYKIIDNVHEVYWVDGEHSHQEIIDMFGYDIQVFEYELLPEGKDISEQFE